MSVQIIHNDCVSAMINLPDKHTRLVMSSPPYNLGKEYEQNQTLHYYIVEMGKVCKEVARVLVDGGSLCWQVGNYVEDGSIYPLDCLFFMLFRDLGFKLRNRIIWRFGHGLHCSKRFSGRYETILWMTKGDGYVFNLDPVRVPQKYSGKKYFKGPKKGQLSCNPLGKNPGDTWEFLIREWDALVWDIPNVKSNHPEKTIHPCQFPVELAERCILALTNEKDIVLDPFAGVATVGVASYLHNRHAICIEKDAKYVDLAEKRIEDLKRGRLRIRPLGKPIFNPE